MHGPHWWLGPVPLRGMLFVTLPDFSRNRLSWLQLPQTSAVPAGGSRFATRILSTQPDRQAATP